MLTNKESTHPIIINIKSSERITGNISNFKSKPISLYNNDFDTVCLLTASIPRTFYNIPSNSYFELHQNDGETEYIKNINIPEGSYSITNLKTKLQEQLNLASSINTFEVFYKEPSEVQDFKFEFIKTSGVSTSIKFKFNTSLYSVLGFNKNSTNSFIDDSLKSANCVNLSRINTAYIKTDMVKNTSVLSEILDYGAYQMMSLAFHQTQNIEMNSREFIKQPNGESSYNFSLVDSNDEEIDLNGIDYNFSIILYNRNRQHELHSREIKLNNMERMYKIEQEKEKIFKEVDEIETETKVDETETTETTETTNPVILSSEISEEPEFYQTNKPDINFTGFLDASKVDLKYL